MDTCQAYLMFAETQSHFWKCPAHHQKWSSILSNAATTLLQLLQQTKVCDLPTLDLIQKYLHESRTFISKGIVATTLFNFVYHLGLTLQDTRIIIATLFNHIYQQVFTQLWKLRCDQVIAYEQTLGVNNWDKRSKHRSSRHNYSPVDKSDQDNSPQLILRVYHGSTGLQLVSDKV